MGFWNDLKHSFNGGRAKAHAEAEDRRQSRNKKVVKLVSPSSGTLITFHIEAEEPFLHMYVEQLKAMAKALDAEIVAYGKKVTIQCADPIIAEVVRENWE